MGSAPASPGREVRVYQSSSIRRRGIWGMVHGLVLCGGLALSLVLGHTSDDPWVLALVVGETIGLAYVVTAFRYSRSGIYASSHDVVVRNPLRTVRLPWDRVVEFRLGRTFRQPSIAVVVSLDGRAIPAIGIQGRHGAFRSDPRAANELVEALNSELRAHGGTASEVRTMEEASAT